MLENLLEIRHNIQAQVLLALVRQVLLALVRLVLLVQAYLVLVQVAQAHL